MNDTDLLLGLGPSPKPEYLYVSTEHSPVGWHRWNHAKAEPIRVEDPALTGYIVAVDTVEKEYKGAVNVKVNIHVSCGQRNYVIQSGLTTTFSKGVLGALCRLQPHHFRAPLTIAVTAGDEGKVVFGDVWNPANGQRIPFKDQPDDHHMNALVEAVAARIAARFESVPADGGE